MTDVTTTGASAARVENSTPRAYRLARRNGELVLQGSFFWTQGVYYCHEWRDIPIVDLDSPENTDDERLPSAVL